MGDHIYGAFTLLIVVNGQDTTVTCSLCGVIREGTVNRAANDEAVAEIHIASHIQKIGQQRHHDRQFVEPLIDLRDE